jgi:hypothetical protein
MPDPKGTHSRFSEDDQEWQLVDDETHEILCVADTAKELEEMREDYDA